MPRRRSINIGKYFYTFFIAPAIDEKLHKTFMELVPGNYDNNCHVEWGPITLLAQPDGNWDCI